VKHILEAIDRAAQDAAAYMTFDVRRSARSHGWSPEEASSLRVRYSDNDFGIHAEGSHAEKALTKEFGTESSRPTAVMRKYGNNPGKSEAIFMRQLNKHIGGK
jgi:hypothetical protein